jgi:ribosomal protein S13
MIKDFGINKKTILKGYKQYGLNTKKYPIKLKIKKSRVFKKFFGVIFSGKILKQKQKNIKDFEIKNRTYAGVRHKNKYPVRGQRTHTNAKTCRKTY